MRKHTLYLLLAGWGLLAASCYDDKSTLQTTHIPPVEIEVPEAIASQLTVVHNARLDITGIRITKDGRENPEELTYEWTVSQTDNDSEAISLATTREFHEVIDLPISSKGYLFLLTVTDTAHDLKYQYKWTLIVTAQFNEGLVVAYTRDGKPVTAGDLKAQGAMAALLKDALKPNLVQTLEHTPAFVHGGPFANIAHGCNSVTATRIAMRLSDYTVTEAGFGADLGAEKFLDIKCRMANLHPSCVVLVATVRALKYNGGVPKAETGKENLEALEKGLPNLLRHVENITKVYKLPCVVAINRFPQDTEAELKLVEEKCKELGVNVALSEVWAKGGEGGIALANEVIRLCEQPNDFTFSYDVDLPIKDKIEAIVKKIYHGDGVNFTANAEKQIKTLTELGYDKMPICMAKTQYSFTDDQTKLGAPTGFTITVRNVKVSAGAGFLVALTGEIMTMPGLPKVPAAERIDVDEDGKISGLF